MIRAAAYCRVSTDKEDQSNSFLAQQRYFKQYIEQQDGWILSEIYADEGISGTSTKNRTQFNRMMEDARNGQFSLLLTKEVSRFARNILDAIAYTRELKNLGIDVIFITDGIHTRDPDSELRLSILGSLAQEESRRTSQRVKWGQTRRMEQGVVFGHSLLGYRVENGHLTMDPEEAETVQTIFHRYAIEKKSSHKIAAEMESETGNSWTPTKVLRILQNEKYAGDLIQKKTFTPDFLSHKKQKNLGQEPIISLSNHHEAIVSRELWNRTQERLHAQGKKRGEGRACSSQFGFSGKIYCGVCGSIFVARSKYRKDGSICRRWCCSRSSQCKIGKTIRNDLLLEAVCTIINKTIPNPIEIVQKTISAIEQGAVLAEERTAKQTARKQKRILQKMQNVLDTYKDGKLSYETHVKLCESLEKQMYEANHTSIDTDLDLCKQHCLDVIYGHKESTLFLQTVIRKIIVYPAYIEVLPENGSTWQFVFV